jgi:hypothetical protein
MARPRRRAAVTGSALLSLIVLASCAKKGAPTGGPPDIEPPRLIASSPDSGAARVPRDAVLTLTFSEGMDARSTGDAVSIAPRVDIRERRWHGRTVGLALAETLRAGQTYTLFLGSGARDRHGNPLEGGSTVVFSTGDTMPRGVLDGELTARGFSVAGTYLWCYDATGDRAPDSTARDFDAIGVADREGHFRVVGLPVPGRYRLWVFADLNGNRSFEPESDILTPVDTVFALANEHPVARGVSITVSNPRSPGRIRGAVLDSLGIEQGALTVIAVAANDSLRHVSVLVNEQHHYELPLSAGVWQVRAWRDLDRNRTWQRGTEPASAARRVEVAPASDVVDIDFVLERTPGGP